MKKYILIIPFLYFVSCNNSNIEKSKTELKQNSETTSVLIEKTDYLIKNPEKNIVETVIEQTSTKDSLNEVSTKKPDILEEKNNLTEVKKKAIATTSYSQAIKQPETKEVKNTISTAKEVITEETIKEIKEPIVVKANHTAWNKLTKTYVSATGKVNYKGFKSNLSTIDSYLLHLQNTPPNKDWSRNEKLAYWFNLYNASTIHLIATNYPVKSIKDINNGKPWDKKFIKSGTHTYSLNDIENTIVRPNYNEPRLHVAFNCAAVSCPSLLNGAFSSTTLNNQLNSLSKKWINDISKNEIKSDKIEISQIFNWYKVDFKNGVIPFINKYSSVKADSNTVISYKKYDWSLNE